MPNATVNTPKASTFEAFMARVDRLMVRRFGLDSASCEDYNWRDEYDAGTSPAQALENALEYWGFDDEEYGY